jgi:hypothetical protein
MARYRGALERYWVRMLNPSGRTPRYIINARVTAPTMFDAAVKAAQWHLHGAPVLAGRREQPTKAGYSVNSFSVQGYGVRMWVREDY